MNNWHDPESGRHRGGLWSFVGMLSFGLLCILLGAAMVYGLFSYFLLPADSDPPELEGDEIAEPAPETGNGILDPVPDLEGNDLVDIVQNIVPAVVGVNNQVVVEQFGQETTRDIETGSGVVISIDGYIVTNQHVIENAQKIMVLFSDQTYREAELIGYDTLTDLALLKVEAEDLVYIPLGDSDQVNVGQRVLAVGNPLGFQQTVTSGIISALDRQVRVPGSEYAYTFIQTDAMINPGNSGGPLVDMNGNIIGINTAKVSLPGVEGIGFSIPSNIVKRVIDDLEEQGRVSRPHLGVLLEDWIDYSGEQARLGVRIVDIAEGTPADVAGLLPGDVIISIEGKHVHFFAQLFDRLFQFYPGDQITIGVLREDIVETFTVVPDERPERHPLEGE